MRKILITCVLLLATLLTWAQASSFEAKRGVIPGGYNFWIHTPDDYEPGGHRFPLIIFLHGASLCGNNLDRVLRYGTMDAIEKGKRIPMLVVAPQNPGGAWNDRRSACSRRIELSRELLIFKVPDLRDPCGPLALSKEDHPVFRQAHDLIGVDEVAGGDVLCGRALAITP